LTVQPCTSSTQSVSASSSSPQVTKPLSPTPKQATNSSPTAAYFTRQRWLPFVPSSIRELSLQNTSLPFSHYFYTPLPSSFSSDIDAGFSSSSFDLEGNVASGDSRAGLDDDAKREIHKIMKGNWIRRPVNFDEARRIYMERMLEQQGIGRDGRPRDPKFVSFS
jgi:hypothetical protein